MKIASLLKDNIYKNNMPAISVLMETENTKEIQIIELNNGTYQSEDSNLKIERFETDFDSDIKVIQINGSDKSDSSEKKEVRVIRHIESDNDIEGNSINIDSIIRSVTDDHSTENVFIKKYDGEHEINSDVELKVIRIDHSHGSESKAANEEIKVIRHIESDVDLESLGINIDSMVKSISDGHSTEDVFIKKVMIMDTIIEGDGSHRIMTENLNEDIPDLTLVIVSDIYESVEQASKKSLNQRSNVDLKLFPNPANNSTQIQFNLENKALTSIQITNLKGQIIQDIQLGEIVGVHAEDINLSKLSKGTYLIHIRSGEEVFSQKLVVE
ncbi:MAG: T9SS type A sorting domain-containing protein [Crocinitomicaceae bacterium]